MSQKEGFITTYIYYKYANIELGVPVEISTNQKTTKTFDWLTGKRASQKSGFVLIWTTNVLFSGTCFYFPNV